MELSKVKELVSKNKLFQDHPALQGLVNQFEKVSDLQILLEEGNWNEETFSQLEKVVTDFWRSFEEALQAIGFSPSEVLDRVQNRAFFSAEQWKMLQTFQSREAMKKKKTKKIPQRVRI